MNDFETATNMAELQKLVSDTDDLIRRVAKSVAGLQNCGGASQAAIRALQDLDSAKEHLAISAERLRLMETA